MFEKAKLKKEIKKSKADLASLEQKRYRSQAALVEAILTHTQPSDEDVDYFNRYTEKIEAERTHLHEAMKKLEELEKSK